MAEMMCDLETRADQKIDIVACALKSSEDR
jgi:hypothetical protein